MENLNNVFNPFKIFFVPVQQTNCPGTSVIASCTEDTPYYFAPFQGTTPPSSFTCNEVLDIFDLGDSGDFEGYAYGVPGHYVYCKGSNNGVPASHSPLLIHEAGHALGLLHNYLGLSVPDVCGTNDICPAGNNISYCLCCEDNVCDTEATPWALKANSNCECISHPGLAEERYRNYMIGADPGSTRNQTILCTNYFSAGQVKRIRAYLELSNTLANLQLKTASYTGILPGGIYGNIVVKSGQTLEITSPIKMLPNAYIKVEKGALLEVKSTVIADDCDKMWRGIIVDGTTQASQTTQNQGKVLVNYQGRIEQAMVGIEVQGIGIDDQPKPGTGGGIVTILSGKIVDCAIGIRFGPYSWGAGNNQVSANSSNLVGAEITVTDNYLGSIRPTLLDMTAIAKLNIISCKFWDLRSNCDSPLDRAIGIDAKNATFRVSYNTNFRNLRVGIIADGLDLLNGSYSVQSSSFNACYRGISSTDFSSFRILGNNFDVKMPGNCQLSLGQKEVKGVELKGNATGFGFYRNSFLYSGTELPDEVLIGTDCIGLGQGTNNVIRENDYINLHVGNRAMGYNGYSPDFDGLVYLCNTHHEFTASSGSASPSDYLVTEGSSVRKNQNDIDISNQGVLPTGNVFSDQLVSFYNLGPIIDYHFFNDGNQNPGSNAIGINPVDINKPNGNCPAPPVPPCDPCTTLVELAQLKAHFYQTRQQWLDKKAELPYLTDTTIIKAKKDTIYLLRLELNKDGSRILRHYEQDTVLIQVDTILAWLHLLETYPADLRLVSHYFFTSDFNTFDTLWSQIPGKYDLQAASLDEFDELGIVYSTVRPHLESDGALHQLPQTILDSLHYWADWCSEPGFLSQRLLWRNGIDAVPDCPGDGIGQRAKEQKEVKQNPSLKAFRIYPNPANESVIVEFAEGLVEGKIILYNIQGVPILNHMWVQTNQVTLPTSYLVPGIYFIEIHTAPGITHRSKVIINH